MHDVNRSIVFSVRLNEYEAADVRDACGRLGIPPEELFRRSALARANALARVSRVRVVGLCPDAPGRPAFHPASRSGRQLARLTGVTPEALGLVFDLTNLSDRPGASRAKLREGARGISLGRGTRTILCGAEVLRAFGKRAWCLWGFGVGVTPDLRWYTCAEGGLALAVPHPSGRSRAWSDSEIRKRTAALLSEAAELARPEL